MFKKIQHIHFIGIGGAGMSGIAEVLLTLGYKVTGSDMKESDVTRRLQSLGASIFVGHREQQVIGAHVVVTSTAIERHNPELREALRQKIPVIPRVEMLAELARLKYAVTVAGTHGKTTTTSMVSLVLTAGGLDPTVVVGGRMHNTGTGARVGRGDYLVAEADESDGSFLKLSPTLAVVTNIDDDHLDYWGRMDSLFKAFTDYANSVPFYGAVVLGVDDTGSQRIQKKIRRPLVTYGLLPEAYIRAEDVEPSAAGNTFMVRRGVERLGQITLKAAGRHNVINSLAAVAVGLELSIPFPTIAGALSSYQGVGRRMEIKGEAQDIVVVDDYGHHPTEIAATLGAVKERWPKRRAVVLFQPHRYSRTKLVADGFGSCFSLADRLFLLDIYAAGEKPIDGITSDWLADRLHHNGVAADRLSPAAGPDALREFVKPGDVVLTLGAGDVWKWGEQLLQKLKAQDAPAKGAAR